MGVVSELKRRNVFRVAIAYVLIAWVIVQAGDVLAPALHLPEWVVSALVFFLILGFPLALIFAWAFELTPEGIKLEKDVDRSMSITHMTGRRLDFLIIGVLAVAVVLFAFDKWVIEPSRDLEFAQAAPEATTEQPVESKIPDVPAQSVAVLPFMAMSNGPDDEYFANGLTEEILNSLSHIPGLLVTARTSAFAFKGQEASVPEVAAKLGVAHVVEGSVRRAGEQRRITAQLIRASDGFHLWSDSFDRSSEDILGVQAEIAEKVAVALGVLLDEQQLQRMRSAGLNNPEAFIAFQKGVEFYDLAHEDAGHELLAEANVWFDRALALSPDLSQAYVHRADRYMHLLMDAGLGQALPEEDLTAAMGRLREDLGNATRHAPDEAHRLRDAFNLALLTGKWYGLTALFDEIADQRICADIAWMHVVTLAYGKAREYLDMQRTLIACDPLWYAGWFNAVRAHIWLGEHEEAIEIARKGIAATSHNALRGLLVQAHIAAGQLDQAEIIIARDIRDEPTATFWRAKVAAAEGDAIKAKKLINDFIAAETAAHRVNFRLLSLWPITGERGLANEHAAYIDAMPYGYLSLMNVPHHCNCGAPFDLKVTPNFAKLIEDADLPWPPASPIEWPLKDW